MQTISIRSNTATSYSRIPSRHRFRDARNGGFGLLSHSGKLTSSEFHGPVLKCELHASRRGSTVGGKQALCPPDCFVTGIARDAAVWNADRSLVVDHLIEMGGSMIARPDCLSVNNSQMRRPIFRSFARAVSRPHRAVTSVEFHDALPWLERSCSAAVRAHDPNRRPRERRIACTLASSSAPGSDASRRCRMMPGNATRSHRMPPLRFLCSRLHGVGERAASLRC